MKHTNLSVARKEKNDEFYTQLTDIEKELRHYYNHFKGKIVLCNCDDPFESNFFKYFVINFNRIGLKKLITTCYEGSAVAEYRGGREKPYKAIVTTVSDMTADTFDVAELFKNHENKLTELQGDGDFRSKECLTLLDEADIVVTNPPFSLFREYVKILMEYKKKFIIMGNVNAVTYKEFFPLIKNGLVWPGASFNKTMEFILPDDYQKWNHQTGDGRKVGKVPAMAWYTNLDLKKRHEDLIMIRRYTPDEYPHYDNYDAIEVSKVANIPYDYDGIMGVPITFMDKYNPDQFEIIGTISAPSDPDTLNLGIDYSKYVGYKQTGEKNGRTGSTFGKCPVIIMNDKKHPYYENKDGVRVQTTYHRIFIRNKHKEVKQS